MKRFACLCGGLAVLVVAQSATAQVVTSNGGLAVWYDIRPTVPEITTSPVAPFTTGQSLASLNKKGNKALAFDISAGNLGGPGDGDVLRISPRLPLNGSLTGNGQALHVTGKKVKNFRDQSIKNIYAYITVEPNGAGTDQVISALGRQTVIRRQSTGIYHGTFAPTGAGNLIENVTVIPVTTEWDGQSASANADPDVVGNPDGWIIDAKQVQVPVTDPGGGPIYDVTVGAKPSAAYKVACIQISAGVWRGGDLNALGEATPQNSTFEGFDEVNNLLMTRAVSSGGPAPAEAPDFGYLSTDLGDNDADGFSEFSTGSAPEVNSGGDGSTIGTTSTVADFTIIIQMKGDFNNSGTVTTGDIVPLQDAITNAATLRQRQLWLADMNDSGSVTAGDIVPFQEMLAEAGGNDCVATPALCLNSGLGGPACP